MDIKPDFQRYFWIFVNEDTGYESVQRPSGHIKIEVREGRGKLWVSVQNLLESGKFGYRLYLLNTIPGGIEPVPVGPLHLTRNKGVLEWEFNPLNVANTGHGIQDFGVAAVLVEYRDRENTSVICPLAAYRGKKTLWRNNLADRLYIMKPQQETLPDENAADKYEDETGNGYIQPETDPGFNMQQIYTNDVNSSMPAEEPALYEENTSEEEPAKDTEYPEYTENAENPENQYIAPEAAWTPPVEQPMPENDAQAGCNPQEPPMTQAFEQQTQYPDADSGLNTNCLYLNSNMCGAYVNTGAANPCMGCTLHNQPETVDGRGNLDGVERLRSELDNNFERYDPFHTKRSDYTWWKVTNPVNLNNILYQCNIRSPLLFNPAVMISHFKYRHLIIGIYTDRARQKEYVVCGVFGMHMVDRKPFGDMCKWIQTEGTKPRYGAFGYWIVYLDPETGKILSLR